MCEVVKKNCTRNEPKIVNLIDAFTNLYKIFFVLSWTLCMAGEQSVWGFVWHLSIMVTRYQPRAMSFILTWHNLISLMSHCLLREWHWLSIFMGFKKTLSDIVYHFWLWNSKYLYPDVAQVANTNIDCKYQHIILDVEPTKRLKKVTKEFFC